MAGTSAPQIPHCRDLTLVGERLARTLFTGHSERLGRAVTVTVYPPLADAASRQRFDGAATTAARLGAHPSVLTVHDWGHASDGRPWIVTDRIPAETLDTVLKSQGPLDVERALDIGVLVAGALQTAHRAGIVHGDLSPDRLVFGARGEALVAEIGLAEFGTFPGLGALNNPIRYHAPPEVLERTGVTPASDTYALATTVYALLAGRAPHEKPPDVTDSNASLLLRILQIEVPAIERPDLPAGIDDVLRSGLAHSADKRPTEVIELASALQDVQRRAGLAISEPVVLDLDDLEPGAAHLPAVSPTAREPGPARPPLIRPPLAGRASLADDPGGAAPAAAGGPTLDPGSAPPDLDALPAWYTDPLPNPAGSAAGGDPAHPASDTPPDLADRRFGRLGGIATPWPWGDGPPPGAARSPWDDGLPPGAARSPWDDGPAGAAGAWDRPVDGDASGRARSDTGWLNGHDPRHIQSGAARPGGDGRSTGEHRTPDESADDRAWPPPAIAGGTRAGGRRAPSIGPNGQAPTGPGGHRRPPIPLGFDRDLGPAGRPPIDVSRLGEPLGPPPLRPGRPGGGVDDGATESRAAAIEPPAYSPSRPGSALTRAREARVTGERPESAADDGGLTGGPAVDSPPTDASRGSTGPPALPVIVLIAIVVALTLGVAYMIVTGDDPAEPVSTDELRSNASVLGAADTPAPPTGLVATETAAGVDLAWDGTVGTSYVVRVLSADEAPRPLPPTGATTLVVASSDIEAAGGYCFDVSIAATGAGSGGAEAQAPAPSVPACIRGATADSVCTE
jgi:Protein kinase domain